MAKTQPPNSPEGEAGKVQQGPQMSQKPNPAGDLGQQPGQQTNVELIENIRKIIFRIQRLIKKDATGKLATKQIRDAITKLQKILKAK